MKRKVRIYKDPNGNGGYINKTAQWLNKAQDGTQTGMTPVTAGIMQQMQPVQQQTMQQQPEQDPQEQILQMVVALAQQGKGEDDIKDYLLSNVYGFKKGSQEYAQYEPQILDFVSAVFEKTSNQEEEPVDVEEPIDEVLESQYAQQADDQNLDNSDEDIISDIIYDDEDTEEARYGGVPNKRSYVNKLVRKLRKAAEGDQVEEANTADVRGTEDNPTSSSPGNMNPFIAGVKGQAENHFYKQQAEQMYNNQFGQGMQQQNNMDYAQLGGMRMRRANRKMFGSKFAPPGVTSSKYTFGPLGGLRTADIQYNPLMMASMFPSMSFPGLMSGYGSGQLYKKTTPGRLVTEKIATTINNKSIQDVATATNSNAATTSAQGKNEEVVKNNTDGTVTTTESNKVKQKVQPKKVNTVKPGDNGYVWKPEKDKWGRSKGDKWYGYNPKTHLFENTKDKSKKLLEYQAYPSLTKKQIADSKKKIKNKNYKEKLNNNQLGYAGFYTDAQGNLKQDINKLATGWAPPDDELITSIVIPAGISTKGARTVGTALERVGASGLDDISFNFGQRALNPGQKLLNAGQRLLNPGQKLLNRGQGLLEAPGGTQFVLPFAYGGSIDNPFQDEYGNLQKFIYGDEIDDAMLQNLYQPPINESDLNYSDSKDTTDPYFKHGGLYHFDGEEDSQTNTSNTGKTYSQEELDKLLAEKQKSWETDYQKKYPQQPQKPQMYPGAFGSYGVGQPVWGQPQYGGGRGILSNLYSPYTRGARTYGPAGNPLEYAATAAAITKSGMLPTGIKYSKEKKEDGNWFERKLGFNKDRITTIDYATPEQIKAGVKPGTTPGAATALGMAGNQRDISNMSLKDQRILNRDKRKNKGIPAEADAEAFTATLTGSPIQEQVSSKSADQDVIDFQANQRKQGFTLDPKTQRWVKGDSPLNNIMTSPTPGMSPSQGADIVTGTQGAPVNFTNSQPVSAGTQSTGTVDKSAEEIKRAYQQGTSIPTVVNKGNTTIINAAGEPIDASQYAYGGYIPDYMAYGGYIPMADNGINFSSVSNSGNPVVGAADSPIWGAMDYFSQNKNIINPNADSFKNYTVEPENLDECTEEQKLDPTSKCYEPQTAQLKIKEERGPGTVNYENISRGLMDAGANIADAKDYRDEYRTKYIPGMNEFARGEKQSANEVVNRGEWGRGGKEGSPRYQGVTRKGGSIGKKKSSASGHKINISEFQDLLKLAGLK